MKQVIVVDASKQMFTSLYRSEKVANVAKKRTGGFMKPCGLSQQLQTFVGVSDLN